MSIPETFGRIEANETTIQINLRYNTECNFIGNKIPGYTRSDVLILQNDALNALLKIQENLIKKGYSLLVYDAYRPQKAVNYFVKWSKNISDTKMQHMFYPDLTKTQILKKGYILPNSMHTKGYAIDLTIIKIPSDIYSCNNNDVDNDSVCAVESYIHELYNTGLLSKDNKCPELKYRTLPNSDKIIPFYDDASVDMGIHFDYFGILSWPNNTDISEEQHKMRLFLQDAMKENFEVLINEYWHFNFKHNDTSPQSYDFDIA